MSTTIKTRSKSKPISGSETTSKYFNKSSEDLNEKTIESKKRRKATKSDDSEDIVVKPENWEQILENIQKMRSSKDAVVDTMGAGNNFDENESNPKDKRFHILVGLMLSSQTRDEMTHKTMQSLREYGLTVDHIIETKEEDLQKMIGSVSFFRNKAKFVKKTALILRDQYESDIPDTVEGLISLPGVGPKMAHLAMQIAWDKCTGIAVDTHVHRICNRLNWVNSKTPEKTQKQLELWFPKHLWNDFNHLIVGFGQTICTPLRPKCGECLNQKICPFAKGLDF